MGSSPVFCFFLFMMLLIISVCNAGSSSEISSPSSPHQVLQEPTNLRRNRKMLASGVCTNRDISISQSRDPDSGIPKYIVQIVNTCISGCGPSNIHLHCGWFASAKMVNPRTFNRLNYDDCVVNGGKPLKGSQIIRFTYSNSFMYPLIFKSATFC